MRQPLEILAALRWRDRLQGLLGRPMLELGQGLWIHPCRAVHGWGMGYPIEVVFLDEGGVIVDTQVLLPGGWRVCLRAGSALELPVGSLALYGWRLGDRVLPLAGRPRWRVV